MLISPFKYQIGLAKKSDKKSILRFYKTNHYSARFIGFDNCYLIKNNEEIIASVIISRCDVDRESIVNLANKSQYFLHALVVAPAYRGAGLASMLIQSVLPRYHPLVCFAQDSLSTLYLKQGFSALESTHIKQVLLPALFNRYCQYLSKESSLTVFSNEYDIP